LGWQIEWILPWTWLAAAFIPFTKPFKFSWRFYIIAKATALLATFQIAYCLAGFVAVKLRFLDAFAENLEPSSKNHKKHNQNSQCNGSHNDCVNGDALPFFNHIGIVKRRVYKDFVDFIYSSSSRL